MSREGERVDYFPDRGDSVPDNPQKDIGKELWKPKPLEKWDTRRIRNV